MDKPQETAPSLDFVREIVSRDRAAGKNGGKVITRFPPEPNGYMHVGHANNILLNFGIAAENGGRCNLRFDDTNPAKEDVEFVDAIQDDIRWLGCDFGDKPLYASDYFEKLYGFAVELIRKGLAYVDDLSADEIRGYRGTLTQPGKESPHRNRPVEENLELFERMRRGEFPDGAKVLRAKIDMASPNLNMRDPTVYRIRRAHHHRTGDAWCIYPMYDFTHCLSDALEGITHSICTLEFEDHRPLYDWFIDNVSAPCHPRQIEVSRSNLNYTVTSKRKLRELVEGGHVNGWDDPRMPTLRGLRRRGYTPEAIREFCRRVGISKVEKISEIQLLEHCIREDLNRRARRVMAVLKPLKVVIENIPEGEEKVIECVNNPEDPSAGSRKMVFTRELYIEADDFREDPPKKFFRLAPGREVRLRYAYFAKCLRAVKDDRGGVRELRCTVDPASFGGNSPDGRKVKGTIHWVSAKHAVKAEVRLYDRLFTAPDPAAEEDYLRHLNPDSLKVLKDCWVEPGAAEAEPGELFQFERLGYFTPDPDAKPGVPVFNRTVSLRDSWAKIEKAAKR